MVNCETRSVLSDGVVRLCAHHSVPTSVTCRCWRIPVSLRVKATSGLWSWAAYPWSSSRGKTRRCRARMRRFSHKTWPRTSYKDTSRTRSHLLNRSPHSLRCTPETPPLRRRICSNPSLTLPSPSTPCCTVWGHLAPPTWMCPPGTAGARWNALELHRLHVHAMPPLLAVHRPALPARPPPPPLPLLTRNGKGCPGMENDFLQMGKPGQMAMTTTGRHCTNQPDGNRLHPRGSSPHPTPNTPHQTWLLLPVCGLMEVL